MIIVKYTTKQAGILGFSKKIPSALMGTWDMESNAKRILYILSVVPAEKMQQEVEKCGVFPKSKEICIQSIKVPLLEVPLWAVPREIGYKFLLVEEINPIDHMEEGDMGEVIIMETMETYPKAEEKRESLLSS